MVLANRHSDRVGDSKQSAPRSVAQEDEHERFTHFLAGICIRNDEGQALLEYTRSLR